MEEFQQALITISSHVSPAQRSEGGQGVVVDNGHSSFAADTIHSEGAVTAGLWFVLTWSIYQIKVKVKTVYGEDLQETSRCQSADQTCNWCLTRPRLFILSYIIHSIGSHNYNIIRQFKSQFINSILHNTQRKALLQHLMSISLCQMDHVWYIHLKETVVAASECSIEELRLVPQKVPSEGS